MKPTNFNKARRHYCQIVTALACDDAINAGIIAEPHVTPLLFFFIMAWKNDRIRRWLAPKDPEEIKENNLMMLINYLYEKGNVFEYDCHKKDIAMLLLKLDVLIDVKSYKTIKNNFARDLPKIILMEAHNIFFDISKKGPEKMKK